MSYSKTERTRNGWNLKRSAGARDSNRAGTRGRSFRILKLQGMNRKRNKARTVQFKLARKLKGSHVKP